MLEIEIKLIRRINGLIIRRELFKGMKIRENEV
jgi:hypothetical protein